MVRVIKLVDLEEGSTLQEFGGSLRLFSQTIREKAGELVYGGMTILEGCRKGLWCDGVAVRWVQPAGHHVWTSVLGAGYGEVT